MSKQETTKQVRWYDHGFHLIVLIIAGVLMFAGVMSLVQADSIVKYTLASVVVLFVTKELF